MKQKMYEAYEASVANGRTIELPGLTDEERVIGRAPNTRQYIRQNLHHPNRIGWPSTEEFENLGLLIQALDDQTARVLLVIDDASAKSFLAVLRYAYAHIGYTLHIDDATVLRTPWEKPEHQVASDIISNAQLSMEVA